MQPQNLNSLAARIEALEKRLWGIKSPGGRYSSEAELLQVLDEAGQRYFLDDAADGEPEKPPLELTEAVSEIIEERSRGGGKQPLLSIGQAAVMQLVENLFRHLEYSHDLDLEAFAALRNLQICFARTAVVDVGALGSTTQPARQFLQLSLLACRGCDQHAGFRSQALLARIEQEVQKILTSTQPLAQACHTAQRDLVRFLRQYERESLAIEQGIIDKEHAQALQERRQQTVQAEALGVLAGKRLPKAALDFIDRIWSKYLTQSEDADGRAWNKGVEAIHSLARSLSIREPEQMLACYNGQLAEVLEVFRKGAEKVQPDSPLTRRFLEQMEAFCLQVLEGGEPDTDQMAHLPGDAYSLDRAEVTEATELARIEAMGQGQWFRLKGDGVEKRGKLIQINSEDQYCLFVNYSGIKTERLNFRRVIEGLDSGAIAQVEMKTVYPRALAYAGERMKEHILQLEAKVEEVEAERQRVLELAQKEVERMQAGGRLELINGQKKLVCELGVRLRSTRKMIFVDALGRKQMELMPEELAQRIAAGNGRILDFGATFDDTLRGLVVEHSGRIPVG